jgi:hypothetical protein
MTPYTEELSHVVPDHNGFLNINKDDIVLPRYRMVQLNSEDIPDTQTHLGEWFNTISGEFATSITIIPVDMKVSRAAMPRQYRSDSRPLCASSDGQHADERFFDDGFAELAREYGDFGFTGVCEDCPLAKFGPDGQKPVCAKVYVYHVMTDDGHEAIIRLKRSAHKVGKQINTIIRQYYFTRWIKLTAKTEHNTMGTFTTCTPAIGEKIPKPLVDKIKRLQANPILHAFGAFDDDDETPEAEPVEPEPVEADPEPEPEPEPPTRKKTTKRARKSRTRTASTNADATGDKDIPF